MNIRLATRKDYENIRDFYYSLTDDMNKTVFKPGWKKDISPTHEYLITSIEK